MQDPTQLYTRHDAAPGDAVPDGLGVLVTLTGHLDAGHVGRQVGAGLRERLAHRTVARFDVDQLHDYRARRPRIRFDRERYTDLRMPALDVELMEDLLGHPFLLVAGPEPDMQWGRFTAALLGLLQEWEASSATSWTPRRCRCPTPAASG